MTLSRTRWTRGNVARASIGQLCYMLGFSRRLSFPASHQRGRNRNGKLLTGRFWVIHSDPDLLLSQGRDKFKHAMKSVHPDVGGTVEEAARLNLIWARFKRLIDRRKAIAG